MLAELQSGVELLCSKIQTSGDWLCSTHKYEFHIVQFFPGPKNCTKWGPHRLELLEQVD